MSTKSEVDPVWTRKVRKKLAKHTSLFCEQSKILVEFAAEVVHTYPAGKERKAYLDWLVQEAKDEGFDLTFKLQPDGITYTWRQRPMRFKYTRLPAGEVPPTG